MRMRMAKLAIAGHRAHTPGRVALPRRRDLLTHGEHLIDDTQLFENGQAIGLQHETDPFRCQLGPPFEDRHAQTRLGAGHGDAEAAEAGADDRHVDLLGLRRRHAANPTSHVTGIG